MHFLLLQTEYGSFYKTFASEAEMYQYLMEHQFVMHRLHETVKGLVNIKEKNLQFKRANSKAFIVSSIPAGAEYLAIK